MEENKARGINEKGRNRETESQTWIKEDKK